VKRCRSTGGSGTPRRWRSARYFVDARVLSIFEGADEILALKVIARHLVEQGRRGVDADSGSDPA